MITGTLLLHFIVNLAEDGEDPRVICVANERHRFQFLTENHLDAFIWLVSMMKPSYDMFVKDRTAAVSRYGELPETLRTAVAQMRDLGGQECFQVQVQQIIFDQQPLRIRNT